MERCEGNRGFQLIQISMWLQAKKNYCKVCRVDGLVSRSAASGTRRLPYSEQRRRTSHVRHAARIPSRYVFVEASSLWAAKPKTRALVKGSAKQSFHAGHGARIPKRDVAILFGGGEWIIEPRVSRSVDALVVQSGQSQLGDAQERDHERRGGGG